MAKDESDRGRTVSDLMTRDPQCVTERESLREVARKMKSADVGSLPVVQSDGDKKIIGMVTDRDIVVRILADGRNPDDCTVRDAMTDHVVSVHENDSLDRVFQVMSENQIRRVPVVNQREEIVGIVAQADIATQTEQEHRVARTIEEISERSH
ncbi:MAG: CBS domain-containing protein [Thermoanaerobaculia bacterium]